MIDHLQGGAFNAVGVQGEDPQGGETHVRHAGVGNELLHVALRQGGDAAVEDANTDASIHAETCERGDRETEARNPYAPIFSSTLARRTLPAVGASTWLLAARCGMGTSVLLRQRPQRCQENPHLMVAGYGWPSGPGSRMYAENCAGRGR